MLNEDYKDRLQAFVEEKAKFLLVGVYALVAHGYLRATMDIAIWVMPSRYRAVAGGGAGSVGGGISNG